MFFFQPASCFFNCLGFAMLQALKKKKVAELIKVTLSYALSLLVGT